MPADSERPLYKILSTKTIWWASGLILVVAVAVTTWLLLAFGYQLEAIKTASTIVLGTGGAAALLLAARRQRSTELALNQKDRDLAHQERDAIERRITDLYTKAADQLGSDKAPVRLAGLYALERVAQDNPPQRQTIVNLLCAYLRMPYQPPGDESEPDHRDRLQEREVRFTAQRLLADHLHPSEPTFWENATLDLTGATLIDFTLTYCALRTVSFRSATFTGDADFESTTFTGEADFAQTEFTDAGNFTSVEFAAITNFEAASFVGPVEFFGAHFMGPAEFVAATFGQDADFSGVEFDATAYFGRSAAATFNGNANFERAIFNGRAYFHKVTFNGDVIFRSFFHSSGATFNDLANFDDVVFSKVADFVSVSFNGDASFGNTIFQGVAKFDEDDESATTFAGNVYFINPTFAHGVPAEVRKYQLPPFNHDDFAAGASDEPA